MGKIFDHNGAEEFTRTIAVRYRLLREALNFNVHAYTRALNLPVSTYTTLESAKIQPKAVYLHLLFNGIINNFYDTRQERYIPDLWCYLTGFGKNSDIESFRAYLKPNTDKSKALSTTPLSTVDARFFIKTGMYPRDDL